MVKLPASVPLRLYVSELPSGSDAVTGAPTLVPAAEFSATLRDAFVSPKLGSVFEPLVEALPLADQALVPSSLVARTCTS